MPAKKHADGRVYVGQNISLPPDLKEEAKARAQRLGLTLSAYIQQLIRNNLEGDLTVKEAPGPYRPASPDAGLHPGQSTVRGNPLQKKLGTFHSPGKKRKTAD